MPDMQKFFRSSAANKTSDNSSGPSCPYNDANCKVRKSFCKLKLTVTPKPKVSPSPTVVKSDPLMPEDNLCNWTDPPAPLQRSASCGVFSRTRRSKTRSLERSASGGILGRRTKGAQKNRVLDGADEGLSVQLDQVNIECKSERGPTKKAFQLPFKPSSIKGSPSFNMCCPKEAMDEIAKKKLQNKNQDRPRSPNQIYAEQKKTRCFFEAADAMRSESVTSMDSLDSSPDGVHGVTTSFVVHVANCMPSIERSSCSESYFVEDAEVNGEFHPTYES